MTDELMHYGTKRHSGRYPYGSGENPYQHELDFLGRINDLKSQGLTETEIAKALGLSSTTELRAKKAIAKNDIQKYNLEMCRKLKEKGYSNVAIGERLGVPESTVRNWLDDTAKQKNEVLNNVADTLESAVKSKGLIDIGAGVERELGVSDVKLKTAVAMLKEKGYNQYEIYIDQLGTNNQKTTIKVLAPPDMTYAEAFKSRYDISSVNQYSEDGGYTFTAIEKPRSVDSDRVQIRYNEEGGVDKDGVIELRRGVDELSLGSAQYAQVRIAVDGTHYIKGMAMYSDDMPDGVDIVFNTNKHVGTDKMKVLKEMKAESENPFGSTVVQRHYTDADGNTQLSALNIVGTNEGDMHIEGSWGNWSKSLASQMLSKQSLSLAKRQLKLTLDEQKEQFEEIKSLTNPEVKKHYLQEFADSCDAAAVDLKAMALPRQSCKVILPITDMKETEVYAPTYRNGEKVCLVRYPHGGIFEIPELTVNNKQKTANSVMHNAKDAIGISSKVAERLSGADFDGDTVIVIPVNDKVKINTSKPLEGLKNFDPKESYPYHEGMKVMTEKHKQIEMGKVSNLITDMTLQGANSSEIARAVRHSMVVIDAAKHKLDYTQSYIDNNIAELKKKYQGGGGASTLISRAKHDVDIPVRKEITNPARMTADQLKDYEAGKKVYEDTGESYTKTTVNKKTGAVTTKEVVRTQKATLMSLTDDAHTLSSGTPMEEAYADYANGMKALANAARKEYISTPSTHYSPAAKKQYAEEVSSLNAKLNSALLNAPKERQAQLIANSRVDAKKKANPELKDDKDHLRKIKGQELQIARAQVGAQKQRITPTEKEWEAIQAGAISSNKLQQILANSDKKTLRSFAMPKTRKSLSNSQISLAKSMENSGYTLADIADRLGVSTSTISTILNE